MYHNSNRDNNNRLSYREGFFQQFSAVQSRSKTRGILSTIRIKAMKLQRKLGLLDVYSIATGAMISSGLFVLPGLAHAYAGPGVVISYFLAGIIALPGLLSQAELVSAMPKAGGTYFYVTRSMGPAAGTVDGIITWVSLTLKSSFAIIGMAAFASTLVSVDMRITGVILCILFTGVNIIGVKEAGKVQIAFVSVLLLLIAFYILKGIPAIEGQRFMPFLPNGWYGVFSTAGLVFISYGGVLKVASIAEETRNPAFNVPRAMLLSIGTVILIYSLAVFITSGVLGAERLDHSLTPITDGAFAIMGKKGAILMSIAAVAAFISTANAGIMAASRYPFALARDRLLPDIFGSVHARFGTPVVSVVMTGAVIAIMIFLKLDMLVKMASTVLILTFTFSCLSVIIMRESGVQNYQPKFTAPLYPWIQIVGIGCFSFLIYGIGREAFTAAIFLVIGGLFTYWFYGRIRTSKEFALLHIIQRITAKELATRDLEVELLEIIRERDEIVKDRFDEIIENGLVLDIEDQMPVADFFRLASEKIAEMTGLDASRIEQLLNERERETSTIIAPGIAIPHIIIEGENTFFILMARASKGIVFSEKFDDISTIFILAGTRDERNFHLRALSAIAQIIHDHKFRKRWKAARSPEDIREVILLGKRSRR